MELVPAVGTTLLVGAGIGDVAAINAALDKGNDLAAMGLIAAPVLVAAVAAALYLSGRP